MTDLTIYIADGYMLAIEDRGHSIDTTRVSYNEETNKWDYQKHYHYKGLSIPNPFGSVLSFHHLDTVYACITNSGKNEPQYVDCTEPTLEEIIANLRFVAE